MKKFLSSLCAVALTASVAVTSVLPANAAPMFVPKVAAAQSDVIQIRDRDGPRWKKHHRHFRGDNFRRKNWNNDWNGKRYNDYGWYNGHRGYRYKRYRGDRYHDGFWFPAGAFIAGAIIGGAIANSNTGYYRGGGGSHVQWCYDRYRSYREYDNSWQPYNGPRRECISPYM